MPFTPGISKVTDNTHEMSFHELMGQAVQLQIPLFQRRYLWTDRQLVRMFREIDLVIEGEESTRFLGAIIAVRRPSNPADPQVFEIVDGQQRLTTLYLLMLAGAQVAEKNGHPDIAKGLINTNLIVDWAQHALVNTKLVPSYWDRRQFASIFKYLFATGGMSEWFPTRVRLPSDSGEADGRLLKQFHAIRRHLGKRYNEFGLEGFEQVIEAARTRLTYVFILLKDAASASTVFEGLNDPGVPIGIGDLVRNEVFSRVGDQPELAATIHQLHWVPFQDKLGPAFDEYFFPFCVIHRPSANRADMFREMREMWSEFGDATEVISKLDEYTNAYLAIEKGEFDGRYTSPIRDSLKRLVEMKRPAAIFPFVMRMLRELELGHVVPVDVAGALNVIESFLVRRALCGIEPTGLLGLFRTMWSVLNGPPDASHVAEVIKRRLTVEWPEDSRLQEQILKRPLYASSVSLHVLREYERSLGADVPESGWIEHILPQKSTDTWRLHFTNDQHKEVVHTWGNLLLLTEVLNGDVAQKAYPEKRTSYSKDSMFPGARRLASDYDQWTPETLRDRAMRLAAWAIARWPRDK